MKLFTVKIILLSLVCSTQIQAQLLSLGGKLDQKPMFQAAVNIPVLFNPNIPYDVAFGLDYTTPSNKMPSGLQLQATGMYILNKLSSKTGVVSAGFTAGYLLDFNHGFNNQFRFSPHLYTEFGFLVIKVGYDYLLPLQQGAPFISVGLGGGYLLRRLKVM